MSPDQRPVPVTYQKVIAGLERRNKRLEARNQQLEALLGQFENARLVGRLKTDPRYRVKCDECGVEPFHLCKTPNDNRLRLPHHTRARSGPCGRPMGCRSCVEAYGAEACRAAREEHRE